VAAAEVSCGESARQNQAQRCRGKDGAAFSSAARYWVMSEKSTAFL